MHSLVRRYLKTGIAFLALGLGLGAWMMVERELLQRFPSRYLVSAHTHAILVGFVMMMILGVALWLFPRSAREDTRYSPRAAEVAYWLVGGGTVDLSTAVDEAGDLDAEWGVVLTTEDPLFALEPMPLDVDEGGGPRIRFARAGAAIIKKR